MKARLFAVAGVSAAGLVATSQSYAQIRTTAPPEVVTIKITITDSAIQMHPKSAPRGDIARFILVNVGKKPHVFALGDRRHGSGRQTGFTKRLKPNEQSILVLFLDYRGTIPYVGQLPADRSKPGMRGAFRIV